MVQLESVLRWNSNLS